MQPLRFSWPRPQADTARPVWDRHRGREPGPQTPRKPRFVIPFRSDHPASPFAATRFLTAKPARAVFAALAGMEPVPNSRFWLLVDLQRRKVLLSARFRRRVKGRDSDRFRRGVLSVH